MPTIVHDDTISLAIRVHTYVVDEQTDIVAHGSRQDPFTV